MDHSDEENCDAVPLSCDGDEFMCADESECIPKNWVCDGKGTSCADGSDEHDCQNRGCLPGYWKCDDGQCIPMEYRICDDVDNCNDGSDEARCAELGCQPWLFYCPHTQRCSFMLKDVCDGFLSCPDGSDELNCVLGCPEGFWPCSMEEDRQIQRPGHCLQQQEDVDPCSDCQEKDHYNHKCIPMHKVCDNITDCNDNSDEICKILFKQKNTITFVL